MKAEAYLTEIIRRETQKTAVASKRLARRIARAQLVRAIREGQETQTQRRRSCGS